MLPVFIINLDRRPDRWAAMSAQMDRLGLEATRIPAVDARLLAAQEEWEQETNGNPPERHVDPGALACAYSHRKALRAFLDTGEPAALILEDDAELAADTPALLESVNWWPPGARMITLEASGRETSLLYASAAETPSGRTVHRFEGFASGTAAYLVTCEGAEFVLPFLDDPKQPLDQLFFDHRHSRLGRELRAFWTVPAMARQRFDANTDSDLETYRRDQLGDRTKLRSNLQLLPYKIRLRALRIIGKVSKMSVRYSSSLSLLCVTKSND